jgi:hypothetical protein
MRLPWVSCGSQERLRSVQRSSLRPHLTLCIPRALRESPTARPAVRHSTSVTRAQTSSMYTRSASRAKRTCAVLRQYAAILLCLSDRGRAFGLRKASSQKALQPSSPSVPAPLSVQGRVRKGADAQARRRAGPRAPRPCAHGAGARPQWPGACRGGPQLAASAAAWGRARAGQRRGGALGPAASRVRRASWQAVGRRACERRQRPLQPGGSWADVPSLPPGPPTFAAALHRATAGPGPPAPHRRAEGCRRPTPPHQPSGLASKLHLPGTPLRHRPNPPTPPPGRRRAVCPAPTQPPAACQARAQTPSRPSRRAALCS